jgi:hypothetical protein
MTQLPRGIFPSTSLQLHEQHDAATQLEIKDEETVVREQIQRDSRMPLIFLVSFPPRAGPIYSTHSTRSLAALRRLKSQSAAIRAEEQRNHTLRANNFLVANKVKST